ncbi:hypothetical protein GCM10028801_11310 [Nocardioides maradonensis]
MHPTVEKVVRRTGWKTVRAIGAARLFGSIGSGRTGELWIGDSHAVLLNTEKFPFFMGSTRRDQFVWHLGPRIMHSIATKGFPSVVRIHARRLGRLPTTRRLTCFFVFGEIDVRCHLPRAGADLDTTWVKQYVEQAIGLADSMNAGRIVLVTPPPPSDEIADHVMFPIAGDIEARTAAHRWLTETLVAAVPDDPRITVLDLRPALADDQGRLPAALTYDGCHTNDAGRAAVRALVRDHLAAHPIPTPEETTR